MINLMKNETDEYPLGHIVRNTLILYLPEHDYVP
jgi:hypothetical protein